jgi:hypothetical protein
MVPTDIRYDGAMSVPGQSRPGRASSKPGHVRHAAESGSKFRAAMGHGGLRGTVVGVMPRIMRYELRDFEWTAKARINPNWAACE